MATLTPDERVRYSRHVLLPELGLAGQERLKTARVLVIGAGGLGSPVALYLAAAGVGTLGIADFDRVEPHNLQRQLLHDDACVGEEKVQSAARRLRATNPLITVVEHAEGVTAENALELFSHYDVIVDGTDNFGSRYLNNDAAVLAGRPLVYGSIFKFEGQVAVFDPARGGPCYRCLFPEPPPAGSVPNCGEAGVIGALCGVIGSLQAMEALKLLGDFGEPLRGRLLTYDALAQRVQTLALPRDPGCPVCSRSGTIRSIDPARYVAACAPEPAPAPAPPTKAAASPPFSMNEATDYPLEISVTEAKHLLDTRPEDVVLIDVREPHEWEICRIDGAQHIPMRQIPEHVGALPKDKHLLIQCHHGGRSLRVTEFLRARGYPAVSNVAGGIDAWAETFDPAMRRY